MYIIAAIMLTAMLITSVFSVGMSYMKSLEMQQIRLMGTTAHVAVPYPTDEQIQKLKKLPYVKTVGLQHDVALVEITPEMGNMTLSLHWYDKTEWEKLRVPAISDIAGRYPENYNEIMVPCWILKNMGIDDPQIGMEIPLGFYTDDDRITAKKETFVLSGYCTEYYYIRSGNIGSIYVSEEFAQKSGRSVQSDGAASVAYQDDRNIERYNKQLEKDLALNKNQKIKTVPMYETDMSDAIAAVIAFAAVIIFLMLTGYLLIYNVFYISVSKDVRVYGLLKTIGTTPRQLKRIVIGQALCLCAAGIPLGLAIGATLSFAAVPMALSMFDLETGAEVSFNPVIFIGAAFFAMLTAMTGAAKSARIASKISPVEALRFTQAHTTGKCKRSTDGGKPLRMAWRNMFRERKRAFIVLLSLFLGISVFMTTTTLISGMDTDNYVSSYVQSDFILGNNTLDAIGNAMGKTAKQKFDGPFLEKLSDIDGITDLRITTMEKMSMKYDDAKFEKHMDWFRERLDIKEELTDEQIQNNFWGFIIGIDARYVEEFNKKGGARIDIDAFTRGDIALIGTDDPSLYSDVDKMDVVVTSSDAHISIALGGFVPFGFQYA
jgi:putative ABC transport system permease protein